jgi:hypothetical protein
VGVGGFAVGAVLRDSHRSTFATGTAESVRTVPCLRHSVIYVPLYPALTRWANEFRRGAAWSSESLTTVLTKIEFSYRYAVPGLPYADTACRDFYVLTVLIHPWVLTRLGRPLLPGWTTPHA